MRRLAAILVPLVALAVFLAFQLSPRTAKVPDVRVCGSVFCAQELLASKGLELGRVTQHHTAIRTPGAVVGSWPGAGRAVRRGTTVDVRVSIGSIPRTVPRVIRATTGEAEKILERAGFRLGRVDPYGPDVETGRIVIQRPHEGWSRPLGSPVDVVLGARS